MRKVLPEAEANCKSKCSSGSKTDCCILDCTYRETGVLVNGVFNEQALLRLYENFLDDNGVGKYSAWFPVIEKSIQKCMETSDELTRLIDLFTFKFHLFSAKSGEDFFMQDSRIRHRHNRLRERHELSELSDIRENRTVREGARLYKEPQDLRPGEKWHDAHQSRVLGLPCRRS